MLRVCLSVFALATCLAGDVWAQTPAPRPESKAVAPGAIINLNTATAVEFEALPGIGAKVAARIVEYRTRKGPFRKVEDTLETSSTCPCLLNILDTCAVWPVSRSR